MTQADSVQTIRDYLLGRLPESETERLDELTITDDGYAERVRAVEHDLVDAFARGELDGVVLEHFRSRYLTTPRRYQSTRFARALQSLDEHPARLGALKAGHAATRPVPTRQRWRDLLPMAAAVILAVATVWLALANQALRERATTAELQRDQQLREAATARAAGTAPAPTQERPSELTVATLVLTPPLRSARQLPTVTLNGDGGELAVQLDLEPVDFPAYHAALIGTSGNRVLWRSDRLIARTVGDRKRIDLGVPAAVLSPQDYLIQVSGLPDRGAAEIVGEYRFTITR
jgi:hypothetical protein